MLVIAGQLLAKILPLYALIAMGWFAARYLKASGASLAGTMMYLVTPLVIFSGVVVAPLSPAVIALPLLVWLFCTVLCLVSWWLLGNWFREGEGNLLALAISTGNTGYFGLPVALLLFGEQSLGLYIVCMLGLTLHETSTGFYVAARGRYGAKQCLLRTLRLPSLYAFIVAVIINQNQGSIPQLLQPFFDNLRGAYTVLGMMIIGMSIRHLRGVVKGWPFVLVAFGGRFVLWPLLVLGLCALDQATVQWYNQGVYQALTLISFMPLAANTIIIATLLGYPTQRMASTTLLSTLFALFYVPVMAAWLLV